MDDPLLPTPLLSPATNPPAPPVPPTTGTKPEDSPFVPFNNSAVAATTPVQTVPVQTVPVPNTVLPVQQKVPALPSIPQTSFTGVSVPQKPPAPPVSPQPATPVFTPASSVISSLHADMPKSSDFASTPQVTSQRSLDTAQDSWMNQPPTVLSATPVNNGKMLKYVAIAAFALLVVGGSGYTVFMIKSTTDTVAKATMDKNSQLQAMLMESEGTGNGFTLVEKVEASYENPLDEFTEDSNPFVEVYNPFDEIEP